MDLQTFDAFLCLLARLTKREKHTRLALCGVNADVVQFGAECDRMSGMRMVKVAVNTTPAAMRKPGQDVVAEWCRIMTSAFQLGFRIRWC